MIGGACQWFRVCSNGTRSRCADSQRATDAQRFMIFPQTPEPANYPPQTRSKPGDTSIRPKPLIVGEAGVFAQAGDVLVTTAGAGFTTHE